MQDGPLLRPLGPFPSEPSVRFSGAAFTIVFVLCLAVNWPGRLNENSLEQFIGFYNPGLLGDLHSPLVAWLWSLPSLLVGQPASALIVQSALIAFYAAMLPSPLPRRGLALLHLAAEAAVKLSLVVLAGFVIKDVLLVGLLLAALACLQRSPASPRPLRWLAAAAALLALSLAIRPTNFVMIAVMALAIVPIVRRPWRSRAAALGIVFAALAMTLPVSALFNAFAVKARKDHAELQLIFFDLSGISARTGRDLVRELPGWPAGLPDPRLCYTPSEAAIIAPWSPCKGYAEASRAVYGTGRKRVLLFWLGSIAANPAAYFSHRLDYVSNLLDPVGASRGHPVYAAIAKDPAGRYLYALNAPASAQRLQAQTNGRISPRLLLTWNENPVARGFAGFTSLMVGSRAAPAAALLAALLLLGWTWQRHLRSRPLPPLTVPAAAALAAGNFLMHAMAGVASQERYMYPTIFCAAFALLVAFRHSLHERTPKRRLKADIRPHNPDSADPPGAARTAPPGPRSAAAAPARRPRRALRPASRSRRRPYPGARAGAPRCSEGWRFGASGRDPEGPGSID